MGKDVSNVVELLCRVVLQLSAIGNANVERPAVRWVSLRFYSTGTVEAVRVQSPRAAMRISQGRQRSR